jgi:two-component system nitrate/nitrite response regulator NarL
VKKVQVSAGAAHRGARPCSPLLTFECEKGTGRATRSSGRGRSTRAAVAQVPIWTAPIGTVVVGANVLLREGLARILSSSDFCIIASASCADDRVLSVLVQEQPILLVIALGDDFDAGLRQIEAFKRRCPAGRVAVLADRHEPTEMVSAFRAGANAYLTTMASCEILIKSLELVTLGVTFVPAEILTLISNRQAFDHVSRTAGEAHVDDDGSEDIEMVGADAEMINWVAPAASTHASRLSARQQSILRCLVQGDSNKTIARKMAMAEATVKVHVKAILRKIQVHNRTQAAIWAMSNGSFVATKDCDLPVSNEPLVEPAPNLHVAPVPTAARTNVRSLSMLELNGAGCARMPGSLRLVGTNG